MSASVGMSAFVLSAPRCGGGEGPVLARRADQLRRAVGALVGRDQHPVRRASHGLGEGPGGKAREQRKRGSARAAVTEAPGAQRRVLEVSYFM